MTRTKALPQRGSGPAGAGAARWLELSIRASAEAAEALSALFERDGHGGVVIEPELVPGPYGDEARPAPDGFSVLRTYLPEGRGLEARRHRIEEAIGILRAFNLAPMDELRLRWLEEADWANAWKQHYGVQRIGRRWVIKPSWQPYAARPADRVIELDPGMAFGTGLHPTTQLVLESLEDLHDTGEVAGKSVLDLGTGSGILAIGAARLGAASVLALDVDEVAVRAAAENASTNGCEGVVAVQHATVGPCVDGVVSVPGFSFAARFDGVLANIIARVIAERAAPIAQSLRPGGWLLASGIIAEREHEAVAALAANGLAIEQRLARGDWIALRCRKATAGTPRQP
jgi:ribosomal protein L11 methyltransferase